MRIRRIPGIYLFIVFIICLSFPLTDCKKVRSGMLIATEARLSSFTQNGVTDPGRYITGSRIIAFDPEKPAKVRVLTGDFYSAAYPEISYDGKQILFSAQKNQGDAWQIWEMNLRKLKYRQITSFSENCTDPAWLPAGRLVFSKLTINDTVGNAHCLYTGNIDGSNIRQITFSPCDFYATHVMKDGRLLTVSRQLVPGKGKSILTVMRPDGTKADMFFRSINDEIAQCDPYETTDGKILFIESKDGSYAAGRLVSVSYNRPLHSYSDLSTDDEGVFLSVLPLTKDKYIISYRKTGSERYALYEFDPAQMKPGATLLSDPEYDILDVINAEAYIRPKNLPSEVDHHVKTSLLLCQDINFTGYAENPNGKSVPAARRIEVIGVDSTYGIVEVEDDGSFQLKVLSDKPFRIRTIDEKGNTINGPCSWLWLRPNERLGCIGCHEDPELVPVNRVSLAVKKQPVIIPVTVTSIKEKIVELE